ncbi:unnamed protein product [Acanthoscelides obtectus]|uniref:Uncharacterized protein n=1 Tax=Acanthoscelides obtectus TaxID=200917 RepID=A0A9P0VUA5_ACAOB|nr:unnamed protein product [Acanthoscelides obtectus]CAH2021003.1 unnamed protein product [Acanthoscelides obtectus]CAK1682722.1 hypothetical protein AOBTE_LOCUS33826 [Acanthoscelides obtectus]
MPLNYLLKSKLFL